MAKHVLIDKTVDREMRKRREVYVVFDDEKRELTVREYHLGPRGGRVFGGSANITLDEAREVFSKLFPTG